MRPLTNTTGTLIANYLTTGLVVSFSTITSTQPFQYTGQQRDAERGLYDLRARMRDPTQGGLCAGILSSVGWL